MLPHFLSWETYTLKILVIFLMHYWKVSSILPIKTMEFYETTHTNEQCFTLAAEACQSPNSICKSQLLKIVSDLPLQTYPYQIYNGILYTGFAQSFQVSWAHYCFGVHEEHISYHTPNEQCPRFCCRPS